MISCKILCTNPFNLFSFSFYKITKIKIKSFECTKSIKSIKKMILGTSNSWSTIRLSHRPSNPAWYIVDWRILPHHAGTILHQGMWRFVVPKFSTFFSHPEHPWRTFSLTHCLENYGHSKEQVDTREWKIATKFHFLATIRKW